MLASLLERAEIDFALFERVSKTRPLGACIALGPNVFPPLEQLGLSEDYCKISKPVNVITMYDSEGMQRVSVVDFEEHIER